ncbi:MAG: hypothetical protein HUU50_07680 [Candidatus Brocadiae bacterium]|nr:hypothetical protein [Candidatus Brocadiia bacterium]
MKKPDIARRMLPLLDIIFLLLAFFIILPHGIVTNERLEITGLKERNEKIQNELEYYTWKYGDRKESSEKHHNILMLKLVSNDLYIEADKIPFAAWKQELEKNTKINNKNFFMVKIQDIAGKPTRTGTIESLETILKDLKITYIIHIE